MHPNRHRDPSVRLFSKLAATSGRLALVPLALGSVLGLARCGDQPAVALIQVKMPQDNKHPIKNLHVTYKLNEASSVDATPQKTGATEITLRVADGSSGTLVVDVDAIQADSCTRFRGHGEIEIARGGLFRLPIDLSIATNKLTVIKAGGAMDRLTSEPAGIECGKDKSEGCVFDFPACETVKLKAQPDRDNTGFVSWHSKCSSGGEQCQPDPIADVQNPSTSLTITKPLTVTAIFGKLQALLVTVNGGGKVRSIPLPGSDQPGINCTNGMGACSAQFPQGAKVTLVPVENVGGSQSALANWVGGANCKAADASCTVPISGALNQISATFLKCTSDRWCWEKQPEDVQGNLAGVWASSPTDAWAVGQAGAIVHFDGETWTYKGAGHNHLSAIAGNGKDLYAVGETGTVLKYDRVAKAFTDVNTGHADDRSLNAVSVGINGDVLAAGDGGLIIQFDTQSWSKIAGANKDKALYGINDGYAVGDSVFLEKGTPWVPAKVSNIPSLRGLLQQGEKFFAVVGQETNPDLSGKVVLYDGTFRDEMGTLGKALFGLHGLAKGDMYAVGAEGTIFHYDGNSWTSQNSPKRVSLRAVFQVAKDVAKGPDVFVVGDGATILSHRDLRHKE